MKNDNMSFEYCYNRPNRWLGNKFLEEVRGKFTKNNKSYYLCMSNIDRRNWRFKNGIDEICDTVNSLQNKKFTNISKAVIYLRAKLDIDDFIANKKFIKNQR